jgi:hypothetical protein
VENVFGFLAVKFRVLLKGIETSDETEDLIIKAIVVLHNFLLDSSSTSFHPHRFVDRGDQDNGIWRRVIPPMETASQAIRTRQAYNYAAETRKMRDDLATYFSANRI